ncbi:hypothetical protein POTOM_015688 [Populus tomentosa]|uniref:Defective in cullin neddylation protein n=1 Tax=Populus tomentosa TaxID=118781 RepID=A0A8X8D672_POPTO|nr:hypothetical protein POTOM_015688 [Populus tomentosa]
MDSPGSIFEIYIRYHDIRSLKSCQTDGHDEHESKTSRDALAQLLEIVDLKFHSRLDLIEFLGFGVWVSLRGLNVKLADIWVFLMNIITLTSIFDELLKLMSKLELMADFSEFSRFYDFVFFMCRENGQKNITVNKAVTAWKLILAGRFRLLNQWCDFVQENQRHNISEDTWQQVLAFSRCVHENLEGYDPEVSEQDHGAWPVLIDDFVEHMYRVLGSNREPNFFCNCGDSESQSCTFEDSLPGLKDTPGLKRKLSSFQTEEMVSSDAVFLDSVSPTFMLNSKRSRLIDYRALNWEDNPPGNSASDGMDITKQNNSLGSMKSPCAVEGCLSRGFAGLFSTRSYLQLDRERRVSYT